MSLIFVLATLVLIAGAAIWFASRFRRRGKSGVPPEWSATRLTFRWSYLAFPLAILAISAVAALFFYPRLPDRVAYNFRLDGSPDRWLNRGAVIFWMLAPQFVFTLMAGAIPLAIIKILSLRPPANAAFRLDRLVALMGNMLALPQALLCFTMLDIFSYNSYGVHIMPRWVFTLVIIAVGTIFLGWFFKSAVRRTTRKE